LTIYAAGAIVTGQAIQCLLLVVIFVDRFYSDDVIMAVYVHFYLLGEKSRCYISSIISSQFIDDIQYLKVLLDMM
jgi:hypothetical protein